jgi:hypothetical protein
MDDMDKDRESMKTKRKRKNVSKGGVAKSVLKQQLLLKMCNEKHFVTHKTINTF